MRKVKLAVVYDAIYPFVKGGVEKRNFELGKRLSDKGFEVHLYGIKWWRGADIIYKNGLYLHGICEPVSLYTSNGKRSIWEAFYFGISCLRLLNEDFDIIDCCGFPYFSLFTCKLVALIKGRKLLSTWHEVWGKEYWQSYLGKLSGFGYLIELLSIKLPDSIIAVSAFTASRVKRVVRSSLPIYVVPNGINLDSIAKVTPSTEQADVIYAGRLIDFKHIDLLIKAIALIKSNYPDIQCRIVGDGPMKPSLENLSKIYNLEKNVRFTGFLNNSSDVYACMKSAKVFVLPSEREGFSIAVLEANACGLPVVSVDEPNNAAKELIDNDKNGVITHLNERDISEAILKILNKQSSKSFNSYKKYDWEYIADILKSVYYFSLGVQTSINSWKI